MGDECTNYWVLVCVVTESTVRDLIALYIHIYTHIRVHLYTYIPAHTYLGVYVNTARCAVGDAKLT